MVLKYDRVDELLKQKGMSRRQLARMLSISESTFTSAFVRGSKKSISYEMASAIGEILGVPLEEVADLNFSQPVFDDAAAPEVSYINSSFCRNRSENVLRENGSVSAKIDEYICMLNQEGQSKALEFVSILLRIPEFRKEEKNGKH